jgi:hypothetical protein
MRSLIVLVLFSAAAVLAGTAGAGGWATVGFEPLPDDTEAGATWSPRILVRQHGVTPLGGLRPVVTIEEAGTGQVRTFPARETSEVGTYEADVVFPSPGDWRVVIDSGFGGSSVTYGPVGIRPAGTVDPGTPFAFVGELTAAAAVLALLCVAVLGVRRLRRAAPASS